MPIEGKVKKKSDMRASWFIHYNLILTAAAIFTLEFGGLLLVFTQDRALVVSYNA